MEFTKKEAFIKQIGLYMENQDYESAYNLGVEFSNKFKDELTAYFLMAKAAFRMKKFADAAKAARTAFNLATTNKDMLTCAILLSASYYMQGDKINAYKILNQVLGKEQNNDAERFMFIYSLGIQNNDEAAEHLERLYQSNKLAAREFMKLFF